MKRRKKQIEQHRWVRDPVKEEYWRAQLALWQKSGLSIRAFCKEHGVVETSFYAWRRELIVRARENGEVDELTSPERMTPNTLKDGRGRTLAIRYRQTDGDAVKGQDDANPFVPIRLVHSVPKEEPPAVKAETAPNQLEIALPSGAVIRLHDACDVVFVANLLSALKTGGQNS